MQEAYFSNIESKITTSIQSAKETIKIAMAWFTNNSIFDELIKAMDNGIKVDLILLDDVINWQPYAPDFNTINNHKNGCVRVANRAMGFMHHKFCIVDSCLLITGSYNWTYYAENRNIENIVISTDNQLIGLYCNEFFRLQQHFDIAEKCNRFSREDIEQMEHIDYEMLNYETKKAVETLHLTECPVYETHTTVKIVRKNIIQFPHTT